MSSKLRFMSIVLAGLGLPAHAHHSNAEYDRSVVTELEGEIVAVVWRNPHVGLTIRTEAEVAGATLWTMEAADLIGTLRRGVPEGTFQIGQWVRVAGYASTRRSGRLLVSNVLLPDGTEVLLVGNAEPRWSDRGIGGGNWVEKVPVAASVDERSLFRVWTQAGTITPEFAADPPLTAAARAAHANWDSFNDPALDCVAPGMPRAVTRAGPHPIEFVARSDRIELRMEYFDLERVIHMDQVSIPEDAPLSPLGYSIGRWEGDTLVVETARVNYPYFDIRGLEGVPQSPAVEFTERFTVSEDGSTLSYDFAVTDPATFTQALTVEGYATWRWRPGIEVRPYECTLSD